MEEADGAPACADRARNEEGHAQDALCEVVQCRYRGVEECAVARERHGCEVKGEEARDLGEGLDPILDVGAEARGVLGVEESAGEGFDRGVGRRRYRGHGREALWEGLVSREEDGGDEGRPAQF